MLKLPAAAVVNRLLMPLSTFPQAFRRNESGGIAITFALVSVVVISFVGLAVDYARAQRIQTKLLTAADSAVLTAVKQASVQFSAGNSDWQTLAIQSGRDFYATSVASLGVATAVVPSVDVTQNANVFTASLKFSELVPTTFMQVAGFTNIPLKGTVVASSAVALYTDLHIVIDNSTSMGIGATAADQNLNLTATGCTLACHIADNYGDKDTLAASRLAGATLRIDVAKNAIVTELKKLKALLNSAVHLRVAIYTLSNSITKKASLTADLDDAIDAVKNIELTNEQNQGGTNTTYSLVQLNGLLPVAGAGTTAAAPRGVVILLTDGVQNSIKAVNPTGALQDYVKDPNFVDAPLQYMESGVQYVQAFEPTACTPVKKSNYTVVSLNIEYLVPSIAPDSGDGRFAWIKKNLSADIESNLRSCASSPDLALSASSPKDIADRLALLFQRMMITAPRLTQ